MMISDIVTYTLQCGNFTFTLTTTSRNIDRINRALATLRRGNFEDWDSMTPELRAQYEADVEWMLAAADKAKLRLSDNR